MTADQPVSETQPITGPAPKASTAAPSTIEPSSSRTESSLFYFLNMSGHQRGEFKPLTARQKVKFYAKGLFSPVMLVTAASSAAIAQANNVPKAWGQGAEGYGDRFGNYFAKQAVQRTVRLGLEELLHEDNRYYASGEHGVGHRVLYSLKSSVMARGNDGKQHFSFSELGGIAGGAFISRTWQPSTNNSPSDGLTSFMIGVAANAGTDVLREFLPDVTHRIFRRHENTEYRVADHNH